MMLQAGTERADRYCPSSTQWQAYLSPKAHAFELDDGWGHEVGVPIAFIHAIYGKPGALLDTAPMRGNFKAVPFPIVGALRMPIPSYPPPAPDLATIARRRLMRFRDAGGEAAFLKESKRLPQTPLRRGGLPGRRPF